MKDIRCFATLQKVRAKVEPIVIRPNVSGRAVSALALVVLALLQMGCGPEDYQKTIQQFQDASAVVINTTSLFLGNMNVIEQNEELDNVVFQRRALDLGKLEKIQIISAEEIKIRVEALDALAQVTSNLAQLAQGKAGLAIGDNTTNLSSSLKTLADDAAKLPATKTTFLDNAKFSGILSTASSAVGDVAQLVVEHKARREIERSIVSNDAAITALLQQVGDDAQGAYLRQQSQLGAYGDQLSRDYEIELERNPDPVLLLGLAKTIKDYRAQKSQLSQANPATAIDQMKKAHQALISYIESDKRPKNFAELVTATQNFVTTVKPLGQAVQSLISLGSSK